LKYVTVHDLPQLRDFFFFLILILSTRFACYVIKKVKRSYFR
jgi:hypothetical protein